MELFKIFRIYLSIYIHKKKEIVKLRNVAYNA